MPHRRDLNLLVVGIARVLRYQTWAVCGFRVFVLEDYNSTTSALSLHPLFLATVLPRRLVSNLLLNLVTRLELFEFPHTSNLDKPV